jgi:hypothetical protein
MRGKYQTKRENIQDKKDLTSAGISDVVELGHFVWAEIEKLEKFANDGVDVTPEIKEATKKAILHAFEEKKRLVKGNTVDSANQRLSEDKSGNVVYL